MTPLLHFICLLTLISFSSAQTPGSSSSVRHPRKPAPPAASHLDPGSVSNSTYKNSTFAFTCKIPAGWVLRTDDMNQPAPDDRAPTTTGRVLLAAFSRPPAAHAQDVNSSILIAAEPIAAYPGLQEPIQYFGPLTEIAKSQGFTTVNEPYEIAVGSNPATSKSISKTMVRSDYQKDVGSRVMLQSTLVMLSRSYALSVTFIGGTEGEIEELAGGLSFSPPGAR